MALAIDSKLSHGVFLTKEGNITRAEDVELMIKQAEREDSVPGFKNARRVDSMSLGQLIVRICESNHNHGL